MKHRPSSTFLVVLATSIVGVLLVAGGGVSCGPRMMYKATVSVGTTNPQTAFYAALIAVNAYRYPFENVDATAGLVQTGQVQLGGGNWFAFNIQVQPTGEMLIDPVTNMERVTANGILVPRGIVNRAAAIARHVRRTVTVKTEEQIALEGETLHQQILQGMAAAGTAVPVVVAPAPPAPPSPPQG